MKLGLLGGNGQTTAVSAFPPLAAGQREEPAWIGRAVWALMAVGVGLRIARYLLCFPLWGDECMLAVNFLDRDFAGLLKPLEHCQICPLLFLWIELAAVKLLGFSEWSLRLFPTLCSLAGLLLFRHVAARLLRGVPLLLAVGIFAVAYYPIRHGAEVKQYASDVLVALVLLALVVEWWRKPEQTRWLWLLAAFAPLAVGLSYPAVFIAGGVSLGLLPVVWRRRQASDWLAFIAFNVAVLASFAALYVLFIGPHAAAAHAAGVTNQHQTGFPPLGQPLALLGWLVEVHTSRTFAYPVGGARGASALTAVCFFAALVMLWRQRRFELLATCGGCFGLALLAAALQKYPYGSGTRVTLYLAPLICLLAGLGAAGLLTRLSQANYRRGLNAAVASLVLIAGAGFARDLMHPEKTPYDRQKREFDRWFWASQSHGAEVVCTLTDLNLHFYAGQLDSAVYRCNQRIYSLRHNHRAEPAWDRVSRQRPLRCVVPGPADAAPNAAMQAWLGQMQAQYELTGQDRFEVNPGAGPVYAQQYQVYEFVPRENSAATVAGPADPPDRR